MTTPLWLQVAALDAEGKVTFSDVYAFGHQDFHATSNFIRLTLAGEHTMELSAGHFLPTGTATCLTSMTHDRQGSAWLACAQPLHLSAACSCMTGKLLGVRPSHALLCSVALIIHSPIKPE